MLGALVLLAELCLNGYATNVGARDAVRPAGGGPGSRHGIGNVMPADTIALTFDDGPDPRWTPRVLDVLRRHRARATFFVIGSKVNRYPDLTRRIVAEGHELGIHTFSHCDLSAVPEWRQRIEVGLTANAIAASTGWSTPLVRLPGTSTVATASGSELDVANRLGRDGRITAFADLDTRDWTRPGVGHIVEAATPPLRRGAVVMLHDGGGDRGQTVEAVDRLLTALPDRQFVTVSTAFGLDKTTAAPLGMRLRGQALLWAQTVGRWLTYAMTLLLMVALVLGVMRLVGQGGCAMVHSRRVRREEGRSRPTHLGPVSVIVPAYNEQANIAATVRSLAASDYPEVEIVVVDDGSTDGTAAIVEGLALPNVRLVRQPNGGKAAALNAGIRAAGGELLVLVDGDTVFAPQTIGRLVRPFADPDVGGVSGNTKVANRGGLLGRWQHLEYVTGFNLDRRMFDLARCMPTIPGAVGAFRRQTLREVGGASPATLAEDTDLTLATVRAGWRVAYEQSAIAWTEVPSSLRQLWRQRCRWCYGTMQAIWKHRRCLTEPGTSGGLARRGLLYLLTFHVLLPLCAPAVDAYAIYGLIFLPWSQALAVWAGFLGIQLLTTGYALRLDSERLGPLWALALQQLVYRQLMYLVVVHSLVTALLGGQQRWQRMSRTGTADALLQPIPTTTG